MKKAERQALMIERLEAQGACSYEELETVLGVSNMTIRRDVDTLALQGRLIKTVGGVQRANAPASFYESSLSKRLVVRRREKRAIAREAAVHIGSAESIFLDGSSTCIELAKVLAAEKSGLTIATNSVLVYMELAGSAKNTIICVGGQHDPSTFCLTGARTEDEVRGYYFDKVFFSTKGVLVDEGTFESSVATFRVKQIVAHQCSQVVLLADHSKFGRRALCKVLDISDIHTVITDASLADADLTELKSNVKNVLAAQTVDSPPADSTAALV